MEAKRRRGERFLEWQVYIGDTRLFTEYQDDNSQGNRLGKQRRNLKKMSLLPEQNSLRPLRSNNKKEKKTTELEI